MREIIRHTVSGIDGKMKLGDYLRRNMHLSVSLIKRVKYGGITVGGETVTVRREVALGDEIVISEPERESENVVPMDIPLTVLFEDEWILAVDKPVNMPTHPSRGNHLPTLANAVAAYIGSPFVFRAVNRLDRDTSGIVLIAKNQHASARLSRALARGEFEKRYLARLERAPRDLSGIIDAPIARKCPDNIKRIVTPGGREAVTEYKILKVWDGGALAELKPITGRTHQLRVHMAYIGSPLYADFLYGERVEGETYFLRCHYLSFPHPMDDKKIEIFANTDNILRQSD